MKLEVTISKASNGKHDYMQIMSDDQFSVNIVLVVDEVKVNDHRQATKE